MKRRWMLATPLLGLALLWAIGASAQTLTPPTPQFGFTGFIQEATLDTAGAICTPPIDPGTGLPADRLRGGTMTVNGIKLIVPCNSIVQLPAATMTWGDLFDPAQSAPVGSYIGAPALPVPANPVVPNVKTGLALADNPMPFPSFAVNVNGNVVGKHGVAPYPSLAGLGIPDGTDRYVVGLIVPITQQDLNATSGLVSSIDYGIGAFRVGGIPNDPNCAVITSPLCSGALVQFNDPVGRWGLAHSPDPRFSGDTENVTIHVSTGIPLCIPRVAPPATDPLCPLKNRPLNGDPRFPVDPFLPPGVPLKIFQMPTPALADADPTLPDPRQQVPLMVGDQVIYAGTLYKIDPLKTLVDGVTPDNTAANTYISAHTVDDVMEITTTPGVPPAYVFVEGFLIGANGAARPGLLQEASTRLTVVGFTTDPTRLVEIYARDVNPCTGQQSLRLLATTDPATQPFRTRFVHRVNGGLFMPPTRMYTMRSQNQFTDPFTGERIETLVGNGIVAGEFSLPNFEYVFPENHRFGDPLVPFNFQDLPFLAQGEGPLEGFGSASPIVGQLAPWPGNPAPTPVNCATFGATPVVNAGPDIAVSAGATVTLTGSVTWDANSNPFTQTTLWTQAAGAPVTLTNAASLSASFTAPNTPQALTFALAATDDIGTGSDTVNITVLAPTETIQFTTAIWNVQRGRRGGFGRLQVTATSSDPTAILSLSETAVDGSVTNWGAGTKSPANPTISNWIELRGAAQPFSLTITATKGGSATVTCGGVDLRGRVTCP
ncbi:MAG: hypothetical protein HY712_06635 [candidate division NC10 bacterium]|nr:hypothetical protein [candidate division NC10 bacterium]